MVVHFTGEFDDDLGVTAPGRHLQGVQMQSQHQQFHNQDVPVTQGHYRAQHHARQNEEVPSTKHDLMGIVRD